MCLFKKSFVGVHWQDHKDDWKRCETVRQMSFFACVRVLWKWWREHHSAKNLATHDDLLTDKRTEWYKVKEGNHLTFTWH